MIDLDTGMIIDEEPQEDEEEEEDIQDVRDFLMTCEDTFTDLLDEEDDEVQAFFKDFDIATKTEEISKLLESHPDTLQATFAQLTSEVPYLDFWKRYFFRFGDEERMRDLYSLFQQRQKASENRQAAGSGFSGLSGVTNFLGGAVKALVDDGDEGQQQQHASTGVMNLFGASGRPPFVMNTAVSEDGDDNPEEEEEEEEEELGWDDDDDESDNEDGDVDDSRDSHQIEFKDAAKEKLQEELDQAMAERDQLHKTVEMQSQELKTLKEASLDPTGNKQVEILEMQIFEKNAELAALRASLDDTSDDDQDETSKKDAARQASQGREVERLTNEVATRDSTISELQEEVESMQMQVQSVNAGADTSAQEMMENARLKEEIQAIAAELQTQKDSMDQVLAEKLETQLGLQSLQETVSSLKSENASLRESLESSGGEQASQLASTQQEALQAQTQLEALQEQLMSLQSDLEVTNSENSSLRENLESSGGEQASQLASAQQEALQAQSQLEALQEQLMSLQGDLEVTNQRASGLESDLQATTQASAEKETEKNEEMKALLEASRESLFEKDSELAKKEAQLSQMQVLLAETEAELANAKETPSPSSPASSSTGVKIPVEGPSDVPAGDEREEEEEEGTPPSSPASSSTGVNVTVEDPLDTTVEDEPEEEEEAKPAVTKREGTGDDDNDEADAWDDDW